MPARFGCGLQAAFIAGVKGWRDGGRSHGGWSSAMLIDDRARFT